MSRTYSLVCHETKQTLWVGQGWGGMTTLYAGEKYTPRLQGFLEATRGKPLVLLDNEYIAVELEQYKEFEDED